MESLLYDHPTIFRGGLTAIVVTILMVIFMALPATPLMRAIGVTAAQTKVSSLYYAAFWYIRAQTTQEGVNALQTTYGNIVGLDKEGSLIISVPVGDKFEQSKVLIADTKLTDLYGAAALVGQFRTEDAKFEIYENRQAVIWIRDVPFNVKLIEAGYAIPDPNPPTNIVDKAFATYYWRNFNGSEND